MSYSSPALTLLGAFGLYAVFRAVSFVYNEYSQRGTLRGPPNPSLLWGNVKKLMDESEYPDLIDGWFEEYGHTVVFQGLLSRTALSTIDTKALNHIMMNTYTYQKSEISRYQLSRIVGGGVLVEEEDVHRQQRRIMNPAFAPSHLRELTETFFEKSIKLRDVWAAEIAKSESKGRVEVLSWLGKMTLDVIGEAGFNYTFDSLSGKTTALSDAFGTIFESVTAESIVEILRSFVPALRTIISVPRDKTIKEAHATMNAIGRQLMAESKTDSSALKTSRTRRDLLSLLIRANTAVDIPESQRLSDAAVLSQVPTFLVAGHETTSTATTWALFALTQNPESQKKLREELLAVGTDTPTMDELNALPYLDAVVREALRAHAPVSGTMRIAMKDDYIPFSEPLVDKYGNTLNGVHVKKGTRILIPIQAINRDKSIWGEDAFEFKPERWEKVPEACAKIPGVWGNMLSFLGGPRACIGYKFSIVEMKALLFTLVRAFEFELAVPVSDISRKEFIVERPFLKSDPKAGNQMPLILKAVSQD